MFERIKKELLEREPSVCLPCNLTNEWLKYLAASADKLLGNDNVDSDDADEAASLAVVIRLLNAKTGRQINENDTPLNELNIYTQRFRIELALEEVHRNTEIRYVPATLETILTERDVETWKERSKFSR